MNSSGLVSFPYENLSEGTDNCPTARVLVYPHGFSRKQLGRTYGKPITVRTRGIITGLSAKASSRLRSFCIEFEVVGYTSFAHTWTTRKRLTPTDWDAVLRRMRRKCKQLGIAVIWRSEMSRKRVTPHLHCICFVKEENQNSLILEAWLQSTRESDDKNARRYAVRFDPIDGPNWIAYMSKRSGNCTQSRNGWTGKQWGVWGREKLTPRNPIVSELSQKQSDKYRRIIRRGLASNKGKKIRPNWIPRNGNWVRCANQALTLSALKFVGALRLGEDCGLTALNTGHHQKADSAA